MFIDKYVSRRGCALSPLANDALDRAQLVLPGIGLTTLFLLFACRRP